MFIGVLTAHPFCAYVDTISAFYECKPYFMRHTKSCPSLNVQTCFPFDVRGKLYACCVIKLFYHDIVERAQVLRYLFNFI